MMYQHAFIKTAAFSSALLFRRAAAAQDCQDDTYTEPSIPSTEESSKNEVISLEAAENYPLSPKYMGLSDLPDKPELCKNLSQLCDFREDGSTMSYEASLTPSEASLSGRTQSTRSTTASALGFIFQGGASRPYGKERVSKKDDIELQTLSPSERGTDTLHRVLKGAEVKYQDLPTTENPIFQTQIYTDKKKQAFDRR